MKAAYNTELYKTSLKISYSKIYSRNPIHGRLLYV